MNMVEMYTARTSEVDEPEEVVEDILIRIDLTLTVLTSDEAQFSVGMPEGIDQDNYRE